MITKQLESNDTLSVIIKILATATDPPYKLKKVANLLIPRLMYVQFKEILAIKKALIFFDTNNSNTNTSEYFIKLIVGLILYRENKYAQSIAYIKDLSLDDTDQNIITQKSCITTLKGINYRSLGQKEKALNNFHFSIDNFGQSPKEDYEIYLQLITHYQIAELNFELNNIDKMLALHLDFYKLASTSSYPDMADRAANGIGRAYFELKDYGNALEYFRLAEKRLTKSGNAAMKAKNWHDMALVYTKKNLQEEALSLLNKSLQLREENNFTDAMVSTYVEMAKIHQSQSEYKTAHSYLNTALVITEEFNYEKKLLTIYHLLSLLHEEKQDYKEALTFNKKHYQLSSKVNDLLNSQKENEKIREVNTFLIQQQKIISEQKNEIESFAEKLKEKNSLLQNFASIAAHDLKAPIRTIASFSTILKRKHATIWDKDDNEYLDFITGGISKLSSMIDALLSLSKLENNLPPPQIVNINQLSSDICDRLAILIQDLNANIIIQEAIPDVMGHESLIGQLFQNLIENALKYRSDRTPEIQINCSASKQTDGDYLQFEIRDNGQGIEEHFQPRMFELFSGSNKDNSNGIGLATCKRVITNYDGNIWVKSKIGVGSSIFFTLPRAL